MRHIEVVGDAVGEQRLQQALWMKSTVDKVKRQVPAKSFRHLEYRRRPMVDAICGEVEVNGAYTRFMASIPKQTLAFDTGDWDFADMWWRVCESLTAR
ncbi:MAG: hypothetical protein AB7Q00_14420 [Phycisphaerales bacterium]